VAVVVMAAFDTTKKHMKNTTEDPAGPLYY
jgi:hypothetical protein